MGIKVKLDKIVIGVIILALVGMLIPLRASGEVQQITEIEDKLEGISEEEQEVLSDLFKIQQDIEEMERQEAKLSEEIEIMHQLILSLETELENKQQDYDIHLTILKQVLVNYQRGGPASYLEILLNAENLSDFLKSLNILKDISHNVNDLLTSLEMEKQELQEQKVQLDKKNMELGQRKEDLHKKVEAKELLQKEQEEYLASLSLERAFYEEQLTNITFMWADCRTLFQNIVLNISEVISSGHFTIEDLNLEYGLFTIQGNIKEETFNRILLNSTTPMNTIFRFEEDMVLIEVPDRHLVLSGNFAISGDSAIRFEVISGTFFDIPLESASIEELFQYGSLTIDFKKIAGDIITVNFIIDEVVSKDERLQFVVIPQF